MTCTAVTEYAEYTAHWRVQQGSSKVASEGVANKIKLKLGNPPNHHIHLKSTCLLRKFIALPFFTLFCAIFSEEFRSATACALAPLRPCALSPDPACTVPLNIHSRRRTHRGVSCGGPSATNCPCACDPVPVATVLTISTWFDHKIPCVSTNHINWLHVAVAQRVKQLYDLPQGFRDLLSKNSYILPCPLASILIVGNAVSVIILVLSKRFKLCI